MFWPLWPPYQVFQDKNEEVIVLSQILSSQWTHLILWSNKLCLLASLVHSLAAISRCWFVGPLVWYPAILFPRDSGTCRLSISIGFVLAWVAEKIKKRDEQHKFSWFFRAFFHASCNFFLQILIQTHQCTIQYGTYQSTTRRRRANRNRKSIILRQLSSWCGSDVASRGRKLFWSRLSMRWLI